MDSYYHNTEDCPQGDWVDDYFEIIVEECSNTICDVTDPFTDFTWLEELVNFEDENGFGYYDYAKLYDIDGNSYLEVFSELTGGGSQIYTCDGVLFCERQDSLNCNQFNETTLVETLYDSKCTPTAGEAEAGDNKIDIEAVKVNYPTYVSSEGERNFSFEFKNNGPCRLFETDFAIEMNGTVIETKKVTGSISNGKTFTVRSDEEYYFEPEIEYILKVYPVNPNGNSDLNFTNDTLTRVYNFNRDYRFDINQFVSPQAIAFDGQQEVSLAFANYSNASIVDEVYVNWSVNGIEQSPVAIEDIQGENILVLGDYYFEVDKDYEIKASIDIPGFSDLPLDQLSYFLAKNSSRVDLAISSVTVSEIDPNRILIRIENKGNVDFNDFSINWTYNGIPQEPITGSNNNWRSYAEEIFFDKYIIAVIDTFDFDESIKHTFDFSVDLPANYIDANPSNNFFKYEIESLTPGEEKPDEVYKICQGDSITLQVRESIYYPDAYGISLGCTRCEVSFDNQEWTVNNRIVNGTNSITLKPNATGIYTFSTDASADCTIDCREGPRDFYTDSYDQPDVRIKVIVEACPKQEANCLNNIGEVGYRGNEIRPFNGEPFLAYDVDGNAIDLKGDFVRFDYEIKGPVLTDGFFQPITITCLEEIYEGYEWNYIKYDVCVGDQIEAQFQIQEDAVTDISSAVCNNLKDNIKINEFVESVITNNCTVNFTVNDMPTREYTSIDYYFSLQTADRPQPINIKWNFGFEYQDDCAIACSNTPGLMQTASTFVCAGVQLWGLQVKTACPF